MKKVLLTIFLLIVVVVLAVLGLAATKPDDYTVERSAEMAAPPATVFAAVNDFHEWQRWSPWEKLDPNLQRNYEGPASGEGAVYSWVGNSDVGEGKMTINASEPDSRIGIQLDFIKPFEATSQCEFTFTPSSAGTQVRWTMTGKNNFFAKIMTVFMSMDQMVGKDFETGLASLKALAESASPADAAPADSAAASAP